jgi:hypothetical protein
MSDEPKRDPGVDTTYVFVVRDPDYDNEFTVVGPAKLKVVNIDLGRADLCDPSEYADWLSSHQDRLAGFRAEGDDEAADVYERLLEELKPE